MGIQAHLDEVKKYKTDKEFNTQFFDEIEKKTNIWSYIHSWKMYFQKL